MLMEERLGGGPDPTEAIGMEEALTEKRNAFHLLPTIPLTLCQTSKDWNDLDWLRSYMNFMIHWPLIHYYYYYSCSDAPLRLLMLPWLTAWFYQVWTPAICILSGWTLWLPMATIPTGSSAARGVLLQQGEHSRNSTEATVHQILIKVWFRVFSIMECLFLHVDDRQSNICVAGGMWQFWPPDPRLLPEFFISVPLGRSSERLQRFWLVGLTTAHFFKCRLLKYTTARKSTCRHLDYSWLAWIIYACCLQSSLHQWSNPPPPLGGDLCCHTLLL